MKTQYIIKHKLTNKEHILNAEEKENFYKIQCKYDYYEFPVSKYKNQETWLEALGFGFLGLAFVLTATKIIMKWL
tara:strand:- start:17 stop:241 length:225 start_codon:yes stop_codon:yes gene_type:complete